MRIAGQHTIAAPRHEVWDALHDPAVLARTLPGCNELREVGQDTYDAVLTAGVASIRGTYEGQVELGEQDAPRRYTLRASGSGAPGTIAADAVVELAESGDDTVVSYDADAIVGGMLGGVGQRMVVAVAQRTAGEFFTAVERDLLEGPLEPAAPAPAAPGAERGPGEPRVYAGSPRAIRAGTRTGLVPLLLAAAVGAAIALAGVLVGRRLTTQDTQARSAEDRAGRRPWLAS